MRDFFFRIFVAYVVGDEWRLTEFDEARSSDYARLVSEWVPPEVDVVKFSLSIGPMKSFPARITFYGPREGLVTAVFSEAYQVADADLSQVELVVVLAALVESLLQRVADLRGWSGRPPVFELTEAEQRWRAVHGSPVVRLSRLRHSVEVFENVQDESGGASGSAAGPEAGVGVDEGLPESGWLTQPGRGTGDEVVAVDGDGGVSFDIWRLFPGSVERPVEVFVERFDALSDEEQEAAARTVCRHVDEWLAVLGGCRSDSGSFDAVAMLCGGRLFWEQALRDPQEFVRRWPLGEDEDPEDVLASVGWC